MSGKEATGFASCNRHPAGLRPAIVIPDGLRPATVIPGGLRLATVIPAGVCAPHRHSRVSGNPAVA